MKIALAGFFVCALVLAVTSGCGGGGGGGMPSTSGSSTSNKPPATTLTITTASLPPAFQGRPYSTTISATGGQGALHWMLGPSVNIQGLTLDANTGEFSGNATSAGDATVTAVVTDSSSPAQAASKTFILKIIFPLSLTPSNTLSTSQYSFFLSGAPLYAVAGGVAPFTITYDPGCLPPGVKPARGLASTTNVNQALVSGSPMSTGTFICNITVTDSFSPPEVATQILTLVVTPSRLIFGSTLPSKLLLNRPVSGRLVAAGGTPPYSWQLLAGGPPAGLSFDSSTAQISGTPTSVGPFGLTVLVSDSASPPQAQQTTFGGTVVQSLGRNDTPATATQLQTADPNASISPYIDPPNGVPSPGDQDYYVLQSLGGSVVLVDAFGNGLLDTVLEIVDANGVAFSTCRQRGDTSTTYSALCLNDDSIGTNSALDFQVPGPADVMSPFYVRVLDWRGDARPDMGYILSVRNIATLLQSSVPASVSGQVGIPLSIYLTASGGTGKYAWSLVSGALPPGLVWAGIEIFGGPTTAGTYVVTVKVEDAGPPLQSVTSTITVTISP